MEKIYIKTFGCSLNRSDSEVMAGILKKAGFEIVNKAEDANLVIINSCTVKGPTEKRFFRYLESISKPVVIAGCISATDPEKLEGYSMISPDQLTNIQQVVEETLNSHPVALVAKEKNKRLGLPVLRKNSLIAIIPIAAGCLGEPCAYCKVKAARGHLVSYPREQILEEVRKAAAEGAKEVWLTAQDSGCWGKNINDSLPKLLEDVCQVKGDFRVRLGMANPDQVKGMITPLIHAFRNSKMFRFLHIPVQSGNDEILQKMRRRYTVEDFRQIVRDFRAHVPGLTIATDIICGFPGETREQFRDSLRLIDETKPDVLNRSRFWPRPKTEAAAMPDQVHPKETKERSRELSSIFEWIAFERNKLWERWEGYIIIDEKGKKEDGRQSWQGRNYAYKPVVVFSDRDLLWKKIKVKVKTCTQHDLRAVIV
ncbi:tRNA (N(6)-L-threonylcarbamoyladenosine(37)-C(2))-methylthiotransferase [Candidatus Woesearchaeota archaeon]|nr:tRNA (N(6)-L-threonylcarbamoyladenosine(37)-C(2))-methylthiotransferase [Candidatus Woesearchaeota archaeon]